MSAFDVCGTTYVVKHHQFFSPSTLIPANSEQNPIADDCRKQLLNKKGEQNCRDDGEVKIMNHERPVEDERLAVFHQFASAKYDHIIPNQHDRNLCMR